MLLLIGTYWCIDRISTNGRRIVSLLEGEKLRRHHADITFPHAAADITDTCNTSWWPAGGRSSFTNTSDLIGDVRYSTATVHPCQHLIKYSSISSRGFLKKSAGVIGKTVGVCVSFYDDTGRGTWTRHADHDLTNQCVNFCSAAGRRILTPNCKSMRESGTWSDHHDSRGN